MKVVCDNCGAIYKIPEKKLVKDVNKATCRKCGHRILIRREGQADTPAPTDGEEATLIAHAAQGAQGRAAPEPAAAVLSYPPFGHASEEPTPLPTSPMDGRPVPAEPVAYAPAPAPATYAPQPLPAAPQHQAAPAAARPPYAAPRPAAAAQPVPRSFHDPVGDMGVVSVAQVAALLGALLLGLAGQNTFVSFLGLFVALWGVFTTLFVLLSGHWGRRKAWSFTSAFLGLLLAGVFAGVISLWTPVWRFIQNPDVAALVESITHGGAVAMAPSAPAEPPAAPPVAAPPAEVPAVPPGDVPPSDEIPPVADADEAPRGLLDVITPEPPPVEEPPAPVVPAATSSRTPASSGSATSSSSGTSSSRTPASSSASGSSSSSRTPASASSGGSGSSSSSRTPASSSSTSSTSSSRTPASSSSSSSSSAPATSSSSSSSALPTSVPTTVIDIQIRNNKNVKSCFAAYKQTHGDFPRVTLRFTLENDGHVSSGAMLEPEFQGSALESCLVGSLKMIDFPEFSGPAQTLKYPFRF